MLFSAGLCPTFDSWYTVGCHAQSVGDAVGSLEGVARHPANGTVWVLLNSLPGRCLVAPLQPLADVRRDARLGEPNHQLTQPENKQANAESELQKVKHGNC